ncbi:MAG: hypothetical protein ACYDBB_16565 [Armatimonadota bacterium]
MHRPSQPRRAAEPWRLAPRIASFVLDALVTRMLFRPKLLRATDSPMLRNAWVSCTDAGGVWHLPVDTNRVVLRDWNGQSVMTLLLPDPDYTGWEPYMAQMRLRPALALSADGRFLAMAAPHGFGMRVQVWEGNRRREDLTFPLLDANQPAHPFFYPSEPVWCELLMLNSGEVYGTYYPRGTAPLYFRVFEGKVAACRELPAEKNAWAAWPDAASYHYRLSSHYQAMPSPVPGWEVVCKSPRGSAYLLRKITPGDTFMAEYLVHLAGIRKQWSFTMPKHPCLAVTDDGRFVVADYLRFPVGPVTPSIPREWFQKLPRLARVWRAKSTIAIIERPGRCRAEQVYREQDYSGGMELSDYAESYLTADARKLLLISRGDQLSIMRW